MKKMKFIPGYVSGFTTEERLYLLECFKVATPKTELEKTILKRAITRFMGHPIYHIPLHPRKECPHCEYSFTKGYERHVIACKQKRDAERKTYKVNPTVLEMLNL